MATSPKVRALQNMRTDLTSGKYRENELKDLHIEDVDGRMIRLGDDEALEVIDRRIAAQEAAEAEAAQALLDAAAQGAG